MRKRLSFSLVVLLACISSSLLITACDATKTPQLTTQLSPVPTNLALTSTPVTLPALTADPGWHVVYNHTGGTVHLVDQSFTAEISYAVIGTCLGAGSMIVHIDPVENSLIRCSQTGQPITQNQISSVSGQRRNVHIEIEGTNIQWAVLIETSKTPHS